MNIKRQIILIAAAAACVVASPRANGQESVDRFIQRTSTIRVTQANRQPIVGQQSKQRGSIRKTQYETLPPSPPAGRRPRLRQITSPEYRTTVRKHHSQLVMSEQKISRIAVTSPDIVNFVQYSETQVALIGLAVGSTDLTLWFENDPNPLIYEVTVTSGTPAASSPHGAI
ncbi:MAG: pilus assembly protein N-terminal domain-containing protein, partial [Planctomycetaceae bacterium]